MLVTKEQREALLNDYIKQGRTQAECSGFIDGMYAMYALMCELRLKELDKEILNLKTQNNNE